MDDLLARLERASAALDDLALASSLESVLVRAGRLEEAYLLRWRRGEPSLVAATVAEQQRPVLAALAADPALQPVPCSVCGPAGCGPSRTLLVGVGQDDGSSEWSALGADASLPEAPIVGARRVRRVADLEALRDVSSLVELEVSSSALAGDVALPPNAEVLGVWLQPHAEESPTPLTERLGALHGLRELRLQGRVTDETVDDVLHAIGGALERFAVDAELLTDVGLEALRRAPRLRTLSLDGARWVDGSCFGALVDNGAPLERFVLHGAPRSTWRTFDALGELGTLRSVDLDGVDVDEEWTELAALPALQELKLTRGHVDARAASDLACAPIERVSLDEVSGADDRLIEALASMPTLRELSLDDMRELTCRGWTALSHARELRRLSIERTAVGTDGLVAVAGSQSIDDLTLVGVEGVQIVTAFRAIGRMRQLERLTLVGCLATPVAIEELVLAGLPLRSLTVRWAAATPVRELLAMTSRLPALEHLTVDTYPVPGERLTALAGAPALRSLRVTGRTSLEDEEIAALRECFWLERLELPCGELTRLRLQERLPEVDVRSSFAD